MYGTENEHYVEVFKLFLNILLEYPWASISIEPEFDASLIFDLETSAPPELVSAMGLPAEDTFVFMGDIYPFDEEDASPEARLPFFSTGSVAEWLRERFLDDPSDEDDCEDEDEYDEETFVNVRLKRRFGKWINEEMGPGYVEPVFNFEIVHIYDDSYEF